MSFLKTAELCYLLAFPDASVKPDLGRSREEISPAPNNEILRVEPMRGLKDAPYFQPVDIQIESVGQEQLDISGLAIAISRQRYDGRIQIVECRFRMTDVLSLEANQMREIIQRELTGLIVPAEFRLSGMYEEYIILLIPIARPSPDAFIRKNAPGLARFIRSQREVFDQREIDEILTSRVRYSKSDMTLVDWEGALIIAHTADYQSDIELLKIGNYQLLRYRRLDRSIEDSLRAIRAQFSESSRSMLAPAPSRSQIRRIIQHRLDLMLDFERTEQDLLLIGDWYTAQLYKTIHDEFYLEEWKQAVKSKLDNLENIIETIRENFSLSWQSLMETVQITGWLILLVGYFILFFLDLGLVKSP